jgi:hypothetical protein
MKSKSVILVLLPLLLSIISSIVSADMGPKPNVDIDILYGGSLVSDASFNAVMLYCINDTKDYQDRHLIPQLNLSEYDSVKNCYWQPAFLAWGGDCKDSKCHFSYMPPREFKLAVYIPSLNKVFVTNEVSRANYNSNYRAELSPEGSAKIYETTLLPDSVRLFIEALIITLVIELFTAFIFIKIAKLPKRILVSVLIANLISLPIVWFVFPLLLNILLVMLLSEIFAVVFEAYFIHYFNKKRITLKKSFILSIIMNLASFLIGGFIFLVLTEMLGIF